MRSWIHKQNQSLGIFINNNRLDMSVIDINHDSTRLTHYYSHPFSFPSDINQLLQIITSQFPQSRRIHIGLLHNTVLVKNLLIPTVLTTKHILHYIASNCQQLFNNNPADMYFDFQRINVHDNKAITQVYACHKNLIQPIIRHFKKSPLQLCSIAPAFIYLGQICKKPTKKQYTVSIIDNKDCLWFMLCYGVTFIIMHSISISENELITRQLIESNLTILQNNQYCNQIDEILVFTEGDTQWSQVNSYLGIKTNHFILHENLYFDLSLANCPIKIPSRFIIPASIALRDIQHAC